MCRSRVFEVELWGYSYGGIVIEVELYGYNYRGWIVRVYL